MPGCSSGPSKMYILKFWTNPLQLDRRIIVPFYLAKHLYWGTNPNNLHSGLLLSQPPIAHVITTDASGDGWGGVLDEDYIVKGRWEPHIKT